MLREDLEFRIALYVDGALATADRAALEAEIAADTEAQAILSQYCSLNSVMRQNRSPQVEWDRYFKRLSATIAHAPRGLSPAEAGAPSFGEQAEFAISCLVDGTLPAESCERFRTLVAQDERAAAVFDAHQDVIATTRAIAYASALPVVTDHLATAISSGVTAGSAALADMTETSERQIADYANGSFSADEGVAARARLDADPAARVLLSEYAAVDRALDRVALVDPVPTVKWDIFAEQISAAVGGPLTEVSLKPARQMSPAVHGSLALWKYLARPTGLSVAAMLAVVFGVGVYVARTRPSPSIVKIEVPLPQIAEVEAARVDVPVGAVVDEVTIGPPKLARVDSIDSALTGESDDVVSHPPRAFVASGQSSSQAGVLPGSPF